MLVFRGTRTDIFFFIGKVTGYGSYINVRIVFDKLGDRMMVENNICISRYKNIAASLFSENVHNSRLSRSSRRYI
nr:hypothetical protein [uncultured bacterium]